MTEAPQNAPILSTFGFFIKGPMTNRSITYLAYARGAELTYRNSPSYIRTEATERNWYMQKLAALCSGVFFCLGFLNSSPDHFKACLPTGIKATDIVSAQRVRSTGGIKKTTVEDKLTELKARCKKGKLVNPSGKEIYFFRMTGCWGNPPPDYQEILERQDKELKKLRKRYSVIEMTCNPEGVQIH